jgi:redox-sensitive bicupin YhaK (pirin superfamily)
VTIVYQGEVEHRDSTGGGGRIGPGDVQWMTAGAGILHEEFHSEAFANRGGTLEMMQLWVNLPARDKMTRPRYQTLLNRDIPVVELPHHAGRLRVIAGEHAAQRGPARTFSPLDVWDVHLQKGRHVRFNFADGRTLAVVILHGTVRANDSENVHEAQWVAFGRRGGDMRLDALSDATLLILSGQPLNEPVVGSGPFVMNTQAQIATAFEDFRAGRFGRMPPITG